MARFAAWWKQLSWRRVGAVALVALGIVLAGTTVVAFAYDRAESDKLMPGVKIAGVDVGGMSRDAAIRAVRKPVRYRLAHPIAIHAGKRTLHVVPRKLGVTANVA